MRLRMILVFSMSSARETPRQSNAPELVSNLTITTWAVLTSVAIVVSSPNPPSQPHGQPLHLSRYPLAGIVGFGFPLI
jgi:hypothetical protein